mmetsp:Transcript_4248/g.9704  ORF Transcript_4248/g.9704 Transcript_4248/m.9704 type:complete len:81 (-) Transcript_4248:646-888(-)
MTWPPSITAHMRRHTDIDRTKKAAIYTEHTLSLSSVSYIHTPTRDLDLTDPPIHPSIYWCFLVSAGPPPLSSGPPLSDIV